MKIAKIAYACLLALSLQGCSLINSFKHDDQVVAKADKHKLYKSELLKYIPKGISAEDSTKLAQQYIKLLGHKPAVCYGRREKAQQGREKS